MREIELRAWDKINKRWVHGLTYVLHTSGRLINVSPDIELTEGIGRVDRHGKKIYEGDIVDYLDNTSKGLVKKRAVITDIRHLPDFTCSRWQEVIGNVYKNPELIPEDEYA